MNLYQLGGTKFLATIGAGFCTTLLQWFGKLDPVGNTYMLVIVATVGAFIGGNVVQSVKEKQSERGARTSREGDK